MSEPFSSVYSYRLLVLLVFPLSLALTAEGHSGAKGSARSASGIASTAPAPNPVRDTSVTPEQLMPFSGWKVINLPTDRTLQQSNWLFLISHRFNRPVSVGYSGFYGLDTGATMYLSMGYALTNRMLVTLARSNLDDNVELETRYGLLHETSSTSPVGLSLQGTLNWRTAERRGRSRWRSEVLSYTGQVTVTRTIADQVGLALVPGITVNPSPSLAGEAPVLTLGIGTRWKLQDKVAIVGEWTPILSRPAAIVGPSNRYGTWGAGVEITTAGHVFQVVASNNFGLTANDYLGGGNLNGNVFDGQFRLGFNIFRILDFSKF